MRSHRRCCLCVFLEERDETRPGQIAHLNREPSDSRFDNLVFLCLEHHNEYDGRPSQSKAFLPEEVREYRDKLYGRYGGFSASDPKWTELTPRNVAGTAAKAEESDGAAAGSIRIKTDEAF